MKEKYAQNLQVRHEKWGKTNWNDNNAQTKRKGCKHTKPKGQINWREINKIRPHAVKVSN